MKCTTRNTLCQHIRQLFSSLHIWRADDMFSEIFFNEVSINLNMFGSVMLDWIMSNTDGCLVVTMQSHRVLGVKPEFCQEHFQP
jgi:hypothetical protein